MDKFIIEKDYITKIKRFNLLGRKVQFKIRAPPPNTEPSCWIRRSVKNIVQHTMKGLHPNDQVGVTFCGKSFEERGPGWMHFRDASTVTEEDIWEMISKIFQSNSEGISTDTFCLEVTSVRLPQGRGKARTKKYNNFNEDSTMRRGIVTIKNKDGLCLPRALIVAMAKIEKDPNYEKIRKDYFNLQTQRAEELINNTKITIPGEGAGIPELRKFQHYLKDYTIVVYRYGRKGRDVIFEGVGANGKYLNLLYHEGHYNVITSLTAVFACGYFCERCHVPYNNKNDHRCGGTCSQCQQSPACSKDVNEITCSDCNRAFRGQQCYGNHKTFGSINKKKNVCEFVKRCIDCLKTYKADKNHVCGEYFCKICDKHVSQDHLCYIQPDERKPKLNDFLYIFYDLETRQEKVIGEKTVGKNTIGEINLHEPNLCVFQQRCNQCLNDDRVETVCSRCGIRQQVLRAEPIAQFLTTILNQRKLFKNVIVIAHNGQAFDHQFILNYILQKTDLKPKLIMRGTKIILMQLDNVKFLDSLNFFPMALSKLTKAFDLPPVLKKGYFPHYFNTKENENYIGPLPPVKYYSPDTMKSEERDTFLKWHEEQKNNEFNMRRDLIDYCISDVQILTEACLKFRKLLLEECGVEPFLEATTIASACNLVYRRNFLKKETIGLIPKSGYRLGDNQSKKAIQWLIWEEDQRKINIKHAAKEREALVAGVKVDGFCRETNQVFEFHGCYYHGHSVCLQYNRDQPLHDDPKDTLDYRNERTVAKIERLRSHGYEVIEMWECDFHRCMESNKEMNYLKDHPLLTNSPLNPRDAFYGGRTDNTYKYYKCKSGEKIKYIDVCSLYPWVCKNGKFPIGHPELYVGDNICSKQNLEKIDGLMKCKILPPEGLNHPVLPIKQNKKLMFSICRTCSEHKYQKDCPHTDEERALIGTWVTDEIKLAVDKGYRLLEIYEIWSYEIKQYNKLTGSGGLFTDMMNKFIKMKQQASGWPIKCKTAEEKKKYIEEFLNNEGVKLEFSEIVNNPGLRSLAKLILNSFWGKFGQRENQPKTNIINEPAELYGMLTNPAVEVCHILPVNEETIIVNWEYKDEAAECLSTVNVCIAAYTTAQARMKLYNYLDLLGERVLYYDTDSVIYVSKEGEFDPPTGDFIGDMTNELECYGPDSYITEFASGGPKNYAYKVLNTKDNVEKVVCKVKGLCLNQAALQKVNFDSIKNMILNGNDNEKIHVLSRNIRCTQNHEIVSVPEVKKYRPTSEKRRFLKDFSSVPYGYKRIRLSNKDYV